MIFRRKKQESTTSSRRAARIAIRKGSKPTQKYIKRYTVKEWKGFSKDTQQVLSNRYQVILTDYPKKKQVGNKIIRTARKVDNGINIFNNKMQIGDIFWSDFDKVSPLARKNRKYNSLDHLVGNL